MATVVSPLRRGDGVGTGTNTLLRQAGRGKAGAGERAGEGLPGPGEDLPQIRYPRVYSGKPRLGNSPETKVYAFTQSGSCPK
jgi:hypothetical protein